MDRETLLKEINTAYHELEMKEAELVHALFHRIFEIESGWYNNHYNKHEDGNWSRASYPIPVISVKGYGQTVQDLKDNIAKSDEKEIGFSFLFPFDVDGKKTFEFVKLLRRERFYY